MYLPWIIKATGPHLSNYEWVKIHIQSWVKFTSTLKAFHFSPGSGLFQEHAKLAGSQTLFQPLYCSHDSKIDSFNAQMLHNYVNLAGKAFTKLGEKMGKIGDKFAILIISSSSFSK